MKFDIQTKEVEVNGKKVPVNIGIYTLENGKIYTEAVDRDPDGEEVYKYYDEELKYFLETEKENLEKKIEDAKRKALEAIEKKLNKVLKVQNVVEMMMENAYDDYVGWGGEYKGGIVDAFDRYLDFIIDDKVNHDYNIDT